MIITYNVKHRILNLIEFIYIKIIKIDIFKCHLLKIFNLFIEKINFFKILKKIKEFVYKLKLSKIIEIHLIILIIYLKITLFVFILVKKKVICNKTNYSRKKIE